MSAVSVNYSIRLGKISVRVICPVCGSGGASGIGYQPRCPKQGCREYMQPSSNNKIECTWEEFISYIHSAIESTN